ncbi:MAG: GNAT family N-acetyltransferase [Melioribacteraceae bacterium]
MISSKLTYKPLTTKNWKDFETLFGDRGACGGCWCMAWRLKSSQFEKQKGSGNKKAMRNLVEAKEQIGIIAYVGKIPVGWCSFAPREKYLRLEKSKVLAPIDDVPVWSITCFFMAKEYRKKGISTELLKSVVEFCKKKKVKILEGYPTVPYSNSIPAAFAWTGIPSAFAKAGFVEATRRSKTRPIMRYYL